MTDQGPRASTRGDSLSGGVPPRLTLLVITNGRGEYLERTLESAEENLSGPFTSKVIVDDSGDTGYAKWLGRNFRDYYTTHHHRNEGLSAAVDTGWLIADEGWVFHLEDDFTFPGPVDVPAMIELCAREDLAQVCLQRQSCNPYEANAGGIIKADPGAYTPADGFEWHRKLFSLNPCVYPQWVRDVGWPAGGGEREFTDKLLAEYPDARFGYWGGRFDPPTCWHIGTVRTPSWTL